MSPPQLLPQRLCLLPRPFPASHPGWLSSQPTVFCRIILTSCHSSIHSLAGSQGSVPCAMDRRAHPHTHPGNTSGFPFLALPERTEHTVFFPKLHVPVSFQQESSPQHRSTKSFLLTVSDTPGPAPKALPSKTDVHWSALNSGQLCSHKHKAGVLVVPMKLWSYFNGNCRIVL